MKQNPDVNPGHPSQIIRNRSLKQRFQGLVSTVLVHGLYCVILSGSLLLAQEMLNEEHLAQKVNSSIVTIRYLDRTGQESGIGTGFIIGEDGLVATSLHVIGESRAIEVILADGSRHEPVAIHAWDRTLDLAVIRLEKTGLNALPLGDSDVLSSGEKVVAVGNPMGLERSVVSGLISGFRRFEHSRMIQLAIPIEPGNSGGPLFNVRGEVLGLLNMKSTLTPNLGFATPVNVLKPLLARPNTVKMARWLRLGRLDASRWVSSMGALWSSKVDRISVQGQGSGFGGRSLCHFHEQPKAFPYEVEVRVKLADESGAAGLIFGSDGKDRQYGFYPSNGQMRLTRFEGPSVYQWTILNQIQSPHYREGDWNTIKVRHSEHHIKCYVNDQLVIESSDNGLSLGQIGLAKFRDTQADYSGFVVNTGLGVDYELLDDGRWEQAMRGLESYLYSSEPSSEVLLNQVKTLSPEQLGHMADILADRAEQLRLLSADAHRARMQSKLIEELSKPEEEINLLYACLIIAQHDHPDLNLTAYLDAVDGMAREILSRHNGGASPQELMSSLLEYLFEENGFHGSYADYENAANSYLHKVIDDREGLPITLSVLFIELAERLGIHGVTGLPLPGHFLVRYESGAESVQLIDVFEGGKRMSFTEANLLAESLQQSPVNSEQMTSASKMEIIRRILTNLKYGAQNKESFEKALPYVDLQIAIAADDAGLRLERATMLLRTGQRERARQDFLWLLEKRPPGIRLERIRQALETL